MIGKIVFIILLTHNVLISNISCQWPPINQVSENQSWSGPWFPFRPGDIDKNPLFNTAGKYSTNNAIPMGIPNSKCDDGETSLETDWNRSPVNYTCFDFDKKYLFRPRSDIKALYTKEPIPRIYHAPHRCMSQAIEYGSPIPTFGPHRPLWAEYGEYVFLPKQRWIHNLEHGAIIMLYHPCAFKNEVNILRTLVKKCLYRHIITPYNLLTVERPLALVSWGYRLEMSEVDVEIVVNFIKTHALRGSEQTATDGQYNLMLLEHADVLNNDIEDNQLCKFYDFM